jgi:hypothetical protein
MGGTRVVRGKADGPPAAVRNERVAVHAGTILPERCPKCKSPRRPEGSFKVRDSLRRQRPDAQPEQAPTVQTTHATTTAASKPWRRPNSGVTIGASNPMPFPPVFRTAHASPPFRGSSARAVVRKIPSHSPGAPRAGAKHDTTACGSVIGIPRRQNPALSPVPPSATTRHPPAAARSSYESTRSSALPERVYPVRVSRTSRGSSASRPCTRHCSTRWGSTTRG